MTYHVNLSRFIFIAFFLVVLHFAGGVQAKENDKSCFVKFGLENDKFAHCKDAQRNFETVFIAIHGWKGDCSTTFGSHKYSLFSAMNPSRFYDWDCFNYDSQGLNIDQNVAALIQRMEDLKQYGYKHAVFVTHSTGGILFLDYLMRRAIIADIENFEIRQDAEENIKHDIKISDAMIWAVPINGLKWNLDGLGTLFLGNLLNIDQKILPDLDENSGYLKSLKKKLSAYRTWFDALPTTSKGPARTYLNFLQGNEKDYVVKPINASKALNQKWLWPSDNAIVTITKLPHLKSVADPTAPGAHNFPTKITDGVALLSAPYKLRFHEIFPVNAKKYPISLEKRQKKVIHGLKYYAMMNFKAAIVPSLGFLDFMLSKRFLRSAVVDNLLLESLLDVFKEKFSQKEHAEIALQFLDKFSKLNLSKTDALTPGHGSSDFTSKVLEIIELIRKNGNTGSWSWADSPAPPEIQKAIDIVSVNLTNKILKTTKHDTIRDKALDIMHHQIREISLSAAVESDFYGQLAMYTRSRASKLPSTAKEKISNIFTESIQREVELALLAFNQTNSLITYRSKQVPLWRTFENERFPSVVVNKTNKLISQKNLKLNERILKLNLSIAQQVGGRGNNYIAAGKALDNVESLLEVSPQLKIPSNDVFDAISHKTQIYKWPKLKSRYKMLTK